MGSTEFAEWLNQQAEERGWSFREMARRGGLSSGAISNIMTGAALPGWDLCVGVARALGERPETVFRIAGLLPPTPQPVAQEEECLITFRQLPGTTRATIMAMLRGLSGRPAAVAESRPSYETIEGRLERELLEAFRDLDEDWQRITVEELKAKRRIVRIIGDEENEEEEEDVAAQEAEAA